MTWLGGPSGRGLDLAAVDGGYCSAPAGEGFFEVDFDGRSEIVAFAFEERVFFLYNNQLSRVG